jgi:hypothetical protein
MKPAAEEVLRSFQDLPEPEKHELALEVLRWWSHADHPAMSEEELTAAGAAVFRLYDEEEHRGA